MPADYGGKWLDLKDSARGRTKPEGFGSAGSGPDGDNIWEIIFLLRGSRALELRRYCTWLGTVSYGEIWWILREKRKGL
jgi:hypothetical protein